MSGKVWVYSDPHFFHANICKFTRSNGEPLRPWDDAVEMSEWMIKEYNDRVDDGDRVYILGDLAMNRKGLDRSISRLKGRKVLVKGNHDTDKNSYYSQFFDDVRAYAFRDGVIMSHIPIHPESLSRWRLNLHGHLHNNVVLLPNKRPDTRYRCACVEHTGYVPVLFEEITK